MFNDRNYTIFNMDELDKIDFNQVLETSIHTLRLSVDETKTFVKWCGEEPLCLSKLTTKEGPYIHEEIINILNSYEWYKTIELIP